MINMSLPFFYIDAYDGMQSQVVLNEETSKHIVQVLRMKAGELLNLTDGKGNLLTCEITDDNKKHCTVEVKSKIDPSPSSGPKSKKSVTIAISLLKNTNRFEWFLEKATEIGVTEIIPLLCERTEKEKFRFDRLNGICISAMLQSQQTWLPVLHQPTLFNAAVKESEASVKMVAHCEDGEKKTIPEVIAKNPSTSYAIFIGPEGDFTVDEIKKATSLQCHYVTLGETRLRTETAGVVAATLLTQF
jgi:16S rRNA (uracil1498-N3)-methyltransferase